LDKATDLDQFVIISAFATLGDFSLDLLPQISNFLFPHFWDNMGDA